MSLLRLLLLPLDLLWFTWDFTRGLLFSLRYAFERIFGLDHKNHFPFGCFTELTADGRNACLPGQRYGSAWIFRLICPDVRREPGCPMRRTHCEGCMGEAYDAWRPPLPRLLLVGTLLYASWAAVIGGAIYASYANMPASQRQELAQTLQGSPAKIEKADPARAQAFSNRARTLAQEGETLDAILEYRNALRANPQSPTLLFELATLQLATDDDRGAMRSFHAAVAFQPDHLNAHLELCRLYARYSDPEGVLRHARAILTQSPEHPEATIRLTLAHLALNQRSEAASALAQVRLNALSSPDLLLLAGNAQRMLANPESARTLYKRALACEPDSTDAHLQLARLALEGQSPQEARAVLATLPAQKKQSLMVRTMLAEIAVAEGNTPQALISYRQLRQAYPASNIVLTRLAELLIATGKDDEGFELLHQVIEQAPGDLRPHFALAKLYLHKGLFTRAQNHCESVLTAIPNHVPSLLIAGQIASAKHEYTNAANIARKIHRLRKDGTRIQLQVAHWILQAGSIDEAKLLLDRIATFPTLTTAERAQLAALWEQAKAPKRAEQQYQQLLTQDDLPPAILNNYAMLLLDQQRAAEALPHARTAAAKLPANPHVLDTAGRAELAAGTPQKARKHLTLAFNLQPHPETALALLEAAIALDDQAQTAKVVSFLKTHQLTRRQQARLRALLTQ